MSTSAAKDYGEIKDQFRPGHADYTYCRKYGMRDYRGGGRQSARETAMRVAAGAIARKILGDGVTIRGALVQIGTQKIDRAHWDWDATGDNPFFCPDRQAAQGWEGYLDDVRKRGSSCGAVIEVVAEGVPVGLGAPIYGKLDADLAAALMSINAVKGVEIGDGFAAAALTGEENADEMRMGDGEPAFLSNHAGGILGGISTGQDIVAALRGQADQLDPLDRAQRRQVRQRDRDRAPRAATIPASASAPCRWARRWWPACWPTTCCATAPSAADARAVAAAQGAAAKSATAACTTSAWPCWPPA